MKDVRIKAKEVEIGDNVWEHNIVKTIDKIKSHYGGHILVFNLDTATAWCIDPDQIVMVTNRTQKKQSENEWCECEDSKKCFENATYKDNFICDCGIDKHHYHGSVCGKIVQIG